jgi:hypothetical protein
MHSRRWLLEQQWQWQLCLLRVPTMITGALDASVRLKRPKTNISTRPGSMEDEARRRKMHAPA